MHNQVILSFFIHAALALWPLGDAATNHGEFAKVDGNVEFIPGSAIFVLDDVTDIPSLTRCYTQCIFNPRCLVATSYEDLRLCRLFSTDTSQGTVTGKSYTHVISLVDRGKKQANGSKDSDLLTQRRGVNIGL
jgi:hypothetical protein